MKDKYIEEARGSIDARALVDMLERHALGEIKMTNTQVSAALALLKKVMPDVASAKDSKQKGEEVTSHEDALKKLE